MPELPEVETVVRSLRPIIIGKTILSLIEQNDYARVFAPQTPAIIQSRVTNKAVTSVFRRAKYIVLDLGEGYLTIHLRMTGRLIQSLSPDENPKHITALFQFDDGSTLYFKDYRKFGRIQYLSSLAKLDEKLGPEPLSDLFTLRLFSHNLKQKKGQIKSLLLNQSFIAGLGNIYVDESLWRARIHPETPANCISGIKIRWLYEAIRMVLTAAIKAQGTTIINFYFSEGSSGNFKNELNVFGRQGKTCPRCRTIIKKIRASQRGTHFCPKCQKKKAPKKSGLE